jgi:uncharacterized delta-60 repeat protein
LPIAASDPGNTRGAPTSVAALTSSSREIILLPSASVTLRICVSRNTRLGTFSRARPSRRFLVAAAAATLLVVATLAVGIFRGGGGGVPSAGTSDSLDRSFGSRGKVVTRRGLVGGAVGVALQRDGKIVVAVAPGERARRRDFVLVRYTRRGRPDRSFGSGGKVVTDLGSDDAAAAVALQADGKIVVVGSTNAVHRRSDFALVRYERSGSLDRSFGHGGRVVTDFGADDAAAAVGLQADGEIVVAGATGAPPTFGSNADGAMARYTPDGRLDATFGNDGKVRTSVGSRGAAAVAIEPAGAIVLVGGGSDVNVVRYRSDGKRDVKFGARGSVATDINLQDDAYALALQQRERIVVAGWTSTSSIFCCGDVLILRYTNDGRLDSSFGDRGKAVTDLGSNNEEITALAIGPRGSIVAAGSRDGDFALVRYTKDGSLDDTFGDGGKVVTDLGSDADVYGLALQPDGKIILAGSKGLGTKAEAAALVRYRP